MLCVHGCMFDQSRGRSSELWHERQLHFNRLLPPSLPVLLPVNPIIICSLGLPTSIKELSTLLTNVSEAFRNLSMPLPLTTTSERPRTVLKILCNIEAKRFICHSCLDASMTEIDNVRQNMSLLLCAVANIALYHHRGFL